MFCIRVTDNIAFALPGLDDIATQVIANATLSVDSFFVMGGFLTGYSLLRLYRSNRFQVRELFKSVPIMYLHRYIR